MGFLALLLKIPFLGSLLNWAKSSVVPFVTQKHRLVIEYALLAIVIASATLALTIWFQRERVESKLGDARVRIENLKGRVAKVEQINQIQDGTIQQLETLRLRDQQALTGLNEDYSALAGRDAAVSKRIAELEKQNEAVRAYLDQPVPAELRRVLREK